MKNRKCIMKKSLKIFLIAIASVLGLTLIASVGFMIMLSVTNSKYNFSVDSFEAYLDRCEADAALPYPSEKDIFTGYENMDFHFEQNLWVLSSERWYRMVMTYDQPTYTEMTGKIGEAFAFADAASEAHTGGYAPEFQFGGFDFRTCAGNHYPKSMTFIGLNASARKICFLYFQDPELDSTKDFPAFFREHRIIPEEPD